MRIAGKLVDGDTGKRIDVLNPYNGEVVGTVPRASREQIAGAFELAASYKPKARPHSYSESFFDRPHSAVIRLEISSLRSMMASAMRVRICWRS